MSKIEFVSHESFPNDEYTKEVVYLCLEGKYRIAYIRKQAKTGGMFWTVPMVGVTGQNGKEFFPAFLQDSNFLERDIKEFLEKRSWEKRSAVEPRSVFSDQPKSMDEVSQKSEEIPF